MQRRTNGAKNAAARQETYDKGAATPTIIPLVCVALRLWFEAFGFKSLDRRLGAYR